MFKAYVVEAALAISDVYLYISRFSSD